MSPAKTPVSRRPAFWWCLVVLWAAVLYFLSSQSHLPSGPEIPQGDKVKHAAYFAMGATLLFFALRVKPSARLRPALVAIVIFAAVVGALDEYHQTFTPGRSGNDPWDWLADVTGGLLATWIAPRFLRRWAGSAG